MLCRSTLKKKLERGGGCKFVNVCVSHVIYIVCCWKQREAYFLFSLGGGGVVRHLNILKLRGIAPSFIE